MFPAPWIVSETQGRCSAIARSSLEVSFVSSWDTADDGHAMHHGRVASCDLAAYESREGVKDRGESIVITNLCFKIESSRELKIEDHRKRRTFSGTVLRTNASQIQPAEQSIMELDRRHETPDRLLYWQPPPLRARTWFPGKRPAAPCSNGASVNPLFKQVTFIIRTVR